MNTSPEIRQTLSSALNEAEIFRREKYALYNKNKFYTVLLGILSGFLILISLASPVLFIISVPLGILTYFHFAKYTNVHWLEFQSHYKLHILRRIVESLYPGTSFNSEKHISSTDFNQSCLFSTGYTTFKGEDLISGMLGTTAFEMSELKITQRTSTYRNGQNRTSNTTIFQGLFVVLDFKSSTYGETYIFQDISEKFFGGLGKYLQKTLGSFIQKGSMIYFENHPDFEKDFVVYSTEEEESRRLLTPGLIRTIAELKYKWGITPSLSFIRDKAYIALNKPKDLFKVKFNLDLVEKQNDIIQSIIEEVALCMNLITEINSETIKTIDSSSGFNKSNNSSHNL
jgi:hypothetical protein